MWLAAVALAGWTTDATTPVSIAGISAAAGIPAADAQAAPSAPARHAGNDTCLVCHDDKGATLKGTPHADLKNPRTPAAKQGCESCHGPGQAHVDDDAKGH